MKYIKNYPVWRSVRDSVRDSVVDSVLITALDSVWIPIKDQLEDNR